jgi:hypothetical protein
MVNRCTNPNHPSWDGYGGRGVTVCDRWRDFAAFLEDMGERPPNPPGWDGKHAYWTLDRIDNDRGYEPGNCRWATWSEQADNATRADPP